MIQRALRQQCLKRRHSVLWDDPYHWLRNAADPAVREYLDAENRYAQSVMSRRTGVLQRRLLAEMRSRLEMEVTSPPERCGNWLYYAEVPRGQEHSVYLRKRVASEKSWRAALGKLFFNKDMEKLETILDMNKIIHGHGYAQLGVLSLSMDHKLLAYTVDTSGDERFTLFIKDLESGLVLPEHTKQGVVGVEWSKSGASFYYTAANASQRPYRVHLYKLANREDTMLYEDDDPKHFVDVSRTKDWNYILINVNSKVTSEVFVLDPRNSPTCLQSLQARREGIQYFVEHREGYFYILTNAGNTQKITAEDDYRLVRLRAKDLNSRRWEEVTISSPGCWIEDMDIFKNYLVLYMRESGLPVVQILDLIKFSDGIAPSKCLRRLSLPNLTAAITPGANRDFTSTNLRLSVSSPVMPMETYDIDLTTGSKTLLQQVEIPGVTTTSYTMEHCTATSHDNAQVPLTIVFSKKFERCGENPALLLGYGAYGELLDLSFSSDRFSLLDRGWVLAYAHVRGSGTLGKSWHADGKLLNKKNSFEDFIACARYLIDEKYASKTKIAAWGESAGGLLIAASVNMSPELFKAIVLKVPFLDILNTMLDSSLSLTEHEFDEWGDPSREEFFQYIREYSPYENIKPGASYPAMLVTTSFNDTRVGYWEAAKWVAALRHLLTTNNCRPILLRTSMQGGHFGESGRYEQLKETAYLYAFLIHNVQRS